MGPGRWVQVSHPAPSMLPQSSSPARWGSARILGIAKELFIFQSRVPGPLEADKKAAAGARGLSSSDFAFRAAQFPVTKRSKGGEVRVVDFSRLMRFL